MTGKLMFRGDSRHPTTDNIFTNGFDKQDPSFADPAYRSGGANMSGDLDPVSGVCVSVRFQGAALFPLKFNATNPRVTTYIYAVYVDTDDLLNTHQLQVRDSLGQNVNGQWQNPNSENNAAWGMNSPMWPLCAHEMAVNSIPVGHIISAIRCDRAWTGAYWALGGTYTLGSIYHNLGCNAPAIFVQLARNFIGGEYTSHRNSPLPNGVGGFQLSTAT